ncbi:MAG: hypothetical protein ACXVCS_06175 [Bdellovibrionota bacterium]
MIFWKTPSFSAVLAALAIGFVFSPEPAARAGEITCDWKEVSGIAQRRKEKEKRNELSARGLTNMPLSTKALDQSAQKIDALEAKARGSLSEGRPKNIPDDLIEELARLKGEAHSTPVPRPVEKLASEARGKPVYTDGVYRGQKQKANVGVFPGAFDPPTEAQRQAIHKSLREGKLDEVYVYVDPKPSSMPFADRQKMAELAFGNDSRVKYIDPSSYAGKSYPEVLESLAAKNKKNLVTSISGDSVLAEKYFGQLKGDNVRYLVASRPQDSAMVNDAIKAKFGARLEKEPGLVTHVDAGDISNNRARAALGRGEAPKDVQGLPDSVAQFLADKDKPEDIRHSLVARGTDETVAGLERVPASDVRVTQEAVGEAEVDADLHQLGKDSSDFHELKQLAEKRAERVLPAVRGPDLWGKNPADRIFILDGHHGARELYELTHRDYQDLPKSLRKVMSPEQQKELARDPKLNLSLNVSKTYSDRNEMLQDFAKSGVGLLPTSVENNPEYAGVLAKARAGKALSAPEKETLVQAYRGFAKDVAKLKNDPVRSAMGLAFKEADFSADMRNYSQFIFAREESAAAIRALHITADNATSPKVQEGIRHIMLDDPESVKLLRGLAKPGKDAHGVSYATLNNRAIDKALKERQESLSYKLTQAIDNKMNLDADPKLRGALELAHRRQNEERLAAAAQLWQEGRPDEAFLAKVESIAKDGRLDEDFAAELKDTRDRLRLYRALCEATCEDPASLKQLDKLTAKMGELQDSKNLSRDVASRKAAAKSLAKQLDPKNLNAIDDEIDGMRALGRSGLSSRVQAMVDRVRKSVDGQKLNEQQFHDVRKDLGRLETVTLFNALEGPRTKQDSSAYQTMHQIYTRLGQEHDQMVQTMLAGEDVKKVRFSPEERTEMERVLGYFDSEPTRHSLVAGEKAATDGPGNDLKAFAERTLAGTRAGKSLNDKEVGALEKAKSVGSGELGRDGRPAWAKNYTDAQLKSQDTILKAAGFSDAEVQALRGKGVVSEQLADNTLNNLVDRKFAVQQRMQMKRLEDAVLAEVEGDYHNIELSPAKAEEWNRKVIDSLDKLPVTGPERGRAGGLSKDAREALYEKATTNVVADYVREPGYDPKGNIGFCFGRAFNGYQEALREGVAKENVRKIWAVGAMRYGGIDWQHHVAAIVRGDDGHWYTIDPEYDHILTIREWYSEVKAMDETGKLQIFVSDGKRWSPGGSSPVYPNTLKDKFYDGYFNDYEAASRAEAAEVMWQRKMSNASLNGSLKTGDPVPPSAVFQGEPIYSRDAFAKLQSQRPATAAAVLYQESAERALADARRSYLNGTGSFDDLEKAQARYGAFATEVSGTDEATRRAGYLAQENNYLAKQLALAQVNKKDKLIFQELVLQRSALSAEFLGSADKRAAEIAASPQVASDARRGAVESVKTNFERYQNNFPGRSFEQVLSDPQEAKLLSELAARDAAAKGAAAAEARTELVAVIRKQLTTDDTPLRDLRSEKMAQDLVDLHAAGGKPDDLVQRNPERWNHDLVQKCVEQGICAPKLTVRSPGAALADLSPVARKVLAEDMIAKVGGEAAEEASRAAKIPTGKAPEEVLKDLQASRVDLQKDLDGLTGREASFPALKPVIRDTNRALAMVDERIAALGVEGSVLKEARAATKAEEKLGDQATVSAMNFLRDADQKTLKDLQLDGISAKKATTGEDRLAAYENFKRKVSGMPAEDRTKVFEAVRTYAAKGKDDLAKSLAESKGGDSAALTKAIEKSDEVAAATGEKDAALTHAVFRDEKILPAEQALADAVGATKASGESTFERRALVASESKKVEKDIKANVAAQEKATNGGRAPASIDTRKAFNEKVDTDLAGIKALSEEQRAELAKSLNKAAGKDLAGAKQSLEHMKALATNPDMFETYRLSYVNATKALDKEGNWDKAWELGVKQMLVDSGYSNEEIMKVVSEENGQRFYQQTARCLKL